MNMKIEKKRKENRRKDSEKKKKRSFKIFDAMIDRISGQQTAIEFVDAHSINLATKRPRLITIRSNRLKHLVVIVASIKY